MLYSLIAQNHVPVALRRTWLVTFGFTVAKVIIFTHVLIGQNLSFIVPGPVNTWFLMRGKHYVGVVK